jgi:predicted transcriptional regulator
MKLSEIARILESDFLSGEDKKDREFQYCRGSDLMSDVLSAFAEGSVFLTGLATLQAVRTASISGAGAIVFVRNKKPSPEIVDLARQEDIPLLVTPLSMFVSCGRLYQVGLTGVHGNR